MRKILFILALMLTFGAKSFAQVNIQEMWDFGEDRHNLTTTLEMFKADKWGSTFFFVDITHKEWSATSAYYEISRALNFWQNSAIKNLSLHVEYNGGLCNSFSYDDAWLFGVNYDFHNADFTKTLTLQALYKSFHNTEQVAPLQFTVVWGLQNLFGAKGLCFSGFADIWAETRGYWFKEDGTPDDKTDWVFIAEPQLWYNIGQHFGCDHLNIGGEVEFANNFDKKGFTVKPCLGIKWNF